MTASRSKIVLPALAAVIGCALLVLRPWADTAQDNVVGTLNQPDGLPDADTADKARLEWAEQTLTGVCMVRQGFDFHVQWKDIESVPRQFPYGIDDDAHAARHGFGIAEQRYDTQRPIDLNQLEYDALTESEQKTYSRALSGDQSDMLTVRTELSKAGTPRAGCLSTARAQLYGDLEQWLYLSTWHDDQGISVTTSVRESRRYQDAVADWADCMAGKNYAVADIDELREWAQGRFDDAASIEAARADEIAAAVAEAQCANDTGLVTTAEGLHAVQLELIAEEMPETVAAHEALQAYALETADDLIVEQGKGLD